MKIIGLLLPPAFLVLGITLGHYFPAAPANPQPSPSPGIPAPAAPSPAQNAAVAAPRPGQPALADWWDFLQTLESATLDDLPALWEALPASDPGGPRQIMVVERWAELDPPGALAFFRLKVPDQEMIPVIVFQTWAQLDPEVALTALQGQADRKIQALGAGGFLLSFKEDPARLIQWAKRFTWMDTSQLDQANFAAACPDDLLRCLLEADRPGLYEIAPHLPPWFLLRLETLTLLQQATTDLPGVLAVLRDRTLTKDEATQMAEQLTPLAESAPEKAVTILEALRTASGGAALLGHNAPHNLGPALVKHLAARDPEAAVTFIKQHFEQAAIMNLGDTAYHELIANHPAAALVIATAIPLMPLEIIPMPTFKDRGTALAILPEAPPSWRRDQAMQAVLDQWHRESPDEALTWLKTLPEGEWRERASAILEAPDAHANVISLKLQELTVRHHPDRIESVLEDVRKTAGQAAQSDLPATLGTLADWPSGPAREAALHEAARFGATRDTAGTLARVQQFADPAVQAEGIRGVLAVWTAHEPLAASGWLPTLTAGPVREAAVDTFAETIAALDPSASMAWAATLTDPAARSARLDATYRQWAAEDPTGAAGALAAIPGLSPADLPQLTTPEKPAAR